MRHPRPSELLVTAEALAALAKANKIKGSGLGQRELAYRGLEALQIAEDKDPKPFRHGMPASKLRAELEQMAFCSPKPSKAKSVRANGSGPANKKGQVRNVSSKPMGSVGGGVKKEHLGRSIGNGTGNTLGTARGSNGNCNVTPSKAEDEAHDPPDGAARSSARKKKRSIRQLEAEDVATAAARAKLEQDAAKAARLQTAKDHAAAKSQAKGGSSKKQRSEDTGKPAPKKACKGSKGSKAPAAKVLPPSALKRENAKAKKHKRLSWSGILERAEMHGAKADDAGSEDAAGEVQKKSKKSKDGSQKGKGGSKGKVDEKKSASKFITTSAPAAVTELPWTAAEMNSIDVSHYRPNDLVGRKVEVFWPLDQMLYSGKVTKFFAESGKHEIRYDDGSKEQLILAVEHIRLKTTKGLGPASWDDLMLISEGLHMEAASMEASKEDSPEQVLAVRRRACQLAMRARRVAEPYEANEGHAAPSPADTIAEDDALEGFVWEEPRAPESTAAEPEAASKMDEGKSSSLCPAVVDKTEHMQASSPQIPGDTGAERVGAVADNMKLEETEACPEAPQQESTKQEGELPSAEGRHSKPAEEEQPGDLGQQLLRAAGALSASSQPVGSWREVALWRIPSQRLVGRRIAVYWALDQAFYEAEVVKAHGAEVHVHYLDGSEEDVLFAAERGRLFMYPGEVILPTITVAEARLAAKALDKKIRAWQKEQKAIVKPNAHKLAQVTDGRSLDEMQARSAKLLAMADKMKQMEREARLSEDGIDSSQLAADPENLKSADGYERVELEGGTQIWVRADTSLEAGANQKRALFAAGTTPAKKMPEGEDTEDAGSSSMDAELQPVGAAERFAQGQVVWGRVKGHPWWPGVVSTMEDALYHGLSPPVGATAATKVAFRFFATGELAILDAHNVTGLRRSIESGYHLKQRTAAARRAVQEALQYLSTGELPETLALINDDALAPPLSPSSDTTEPTTEGKKAPAYSLHDLPSPDEVAFPFKVGLTLTVEELGVIEFRNPSYHCRASIWPVGYRAVRLIGGTPHVLEILAGEGFAGGTGPIFRISIKGSRRQPVEGATFVEAWTKLFKGESRVSAIEKLGLNSPFVVAAIQNAPGALHCSEYVWRGKDPRPEPPPMSAEDLEARFAIKTSRMALPPHINPVETTRLNQQASCHACGFIEEWDEDLMLQCDGCGMNVHMSCYNVKEYHNGELWLCDFCKLPGQRSMPPCILCPVLGGAMKRTDDDRWCHVACARWVSELKIDWEDSPLICNAQNINRDRFGLQCYLCRQPYGACIQCNHDKKCRTAFHVLCAANAGLYLAVRERVQADAAGTSAAAASTGSQDAPRLGDGLIRKREDSETKLPLCIPCGANGSEGGATEAVRTPPDQAIEDTCAGADPVSTLSDKGIEDTSAAAEALSTVPNNEVIQDATPVEAVGTVPDKPVQGTSSEAGALSTVPDNEVIQDAAPVAAVSMVPDKPVQGTSSEAGALSTVPDNEVIQDAAPVEVGGTVPDKPVQGTCSEAGALSMVSDNEVIQGAAHVEVGGTVPDKPVQGTSSEAGALSTVPDNEVIQDEALVEVGGTVPDKPVQGTSSEAGALSMVSDNEVIQGAAPVEVGGTVPDKPVQGTSSEAGALSNAPDESVQVAFSRLPDKVDEGNLFTTEAVSTLSDKAAKDDTAATEAVSTDPEKVVQGISTELEVVSTAPDEAAGGTFDATDSFSTPHAKEADDKSATTTAVNSSPKKAVEDTSPPATATPSEAVIMEAATYCGKHSKMYLAAGMKRDIEVVGWLSPSLSKRKRDIDTWTPNSKTRDHTDLAAYIPPISAGGCARSSAYDPIHRRGLREPDVLEALGSKRQYVAPLPHVVTGRTGPPIQPPPVESTWRYPPSNPADTCELLNGTESQPGQQQPQKVRLEPQSTRDRLKALSGQVKKWVAAGKSAIHGWGAFCKVPYRQGDMVVEYIGELVSPSVANMREAKLYNSMVGAGTYVFKLTEQQCVDATCAGNIAHLLNHSCDPNCFSRVLTVDGENHVVILAKRDLQPGEELTYDYRFGSTEKLPCNCGAPKCRGFVNIDDPDQEP